MAKIQDEFPGGVRYYTAGVAHVPVFFPENRVICQYCPFCRSEKELERYWCRLNNEMLYNPFSRIGGNCPIEFDKNNQEDKNE